MNWIKAVRREYIEGLDVRSGWHPFIVSLVAARGGKIGEVKTTWYPRHSGKSKFGFSRVFRSSLNFLMVLYLLRCPSVPPRALMGAGGAALVLGVIELIGAHYVLQADYGCEGACILLSRIGLALLGLLLVTAGLIAHQARSGPVSGGPADRTPRLREDRPQ